MRYTINGRETTRQEVQNQLTAEMREAEGSPYFMGRIHYNLDYIEAVALRFMRETNTTEFHFDDVVIYAQ